MAIQGNGGAANSQQFNELTINPGGAALQAVCGSGGTVNVNLGAITRYAGGTIDFTLPAVGGIATTATTTGPGVLVDAASNWTSYATVNGGSSFATVNGGQIVALAAYSSTNSFSGSQAATTLITQSLSPASGAANTAVVAFGSPNTTLTLAGNNDLADAGGILVTPAATETVITGGSLHAGGGNAIVIMNYGSLNVASAIVDNSPGASLTVSGSGVTTLSGTNSYTGATYVNNGSTLLVGVGGSGASLGCTSGVIDSGSLIFNHGDVLGFPQLISGLGSLTQAGSGVLILTNSNSYTGPTTISNGTLQIGNGTSDGSIACSTAINDNATLAFNLVGSQTYGGVISGSGGLLKTGNGTLTVTGSNAYTGQTIVNGGSLVGSTTSLPGEIALANSANVTFNQSASGAFGNAVSGGGSLTMSGSGMLLLTGSNTYSGGTLINSGTLQVGNGGNSGSLGPGNVVNNGTLILNRSDMGFTVGSAISGSGGLLQNGSGMVTLNGINTYTGPTVVGCGTLQVASGGQIASTSAVTVGSSATGIFVQSGTVNVSSTLNVGNTTGGSGAYYLNGNGRLKVSYYESIDSGVFWQSGGTNLVPQYNLAIGGNIYSIVTTAAGNSTYNLSGGLLSVFNTEYVTSSVSATLSQSGGTNTAGSIYLAYGGGNGGTGTYILSGGLLQAGVAIGEYGTGVFVQTGGTFVGSFSLGVFGRGTYTLSGSGYISASESLGGAMNSTGIGTFTQLGGTNAASSLTVGANYSGTYNLNGGHLSGNEYVGSYGSGIFNQSGGTNNPASLQLGVYAVASGGPIGSGSYNLSGGLLILSTASQGEGVATFNFSGGTLQANRGFYTSLPMTLGASGGGATFDTAGYAMVLSGSLSGPGGLTIADSGTMLLSATNTYTGNTLVSGGTLALGSPLALQNSMLDTSGSGTLSFGSCIAATLGGLAGPGTLSLANSAASRRSP